MATVVVSSSQQLLAALKSAGEGTTIQLASGSYSLVTHGQDFHGAVITAASGAEVTFSKVTLNSVSHLSFDGVDFQGTANKSVVIASSSDIAIRNATIEGQTDGGYGRGHGLWISNNDGFTLENSHISDFRTGVWIGGTDDLTVRGNTIDNISLDGMIVGRVHHAIFADNAIELHVPGGTKHTDGMQFYNSVTNDPLSDVTIRDNVIHTHNSASHGIYMANGLANSTGNPATFFHDVVIEGNTVISGQVSGIAVGQTVGLTIDGNTILQDPDFYSLRQVRTPVIRVDGASSDVSITDNVMHKLPEPSGGNWQPLRGEVTDWTVSGNDIVPIGTTLSDARQAAVGSSDTFQFHAGSDEAGGVEHAAALVDVMHAYL